MLKKELRLNYLNLRKNISKEDTEDFSIKIANNLLGLPIWDIGYYHIFLPIIENKEVDTSFILSILHGKDKNIIIPKISENNNLVNFLLTDSTILKKNSLNIPEPVDGIEVMPTKLDVIFIPLLTYDKKGNRVGYGKGFYDKFLKECRPDIIKVGLSFFAPEDKITDVSDTDIPLDYCITPNQVYTF